MASFPNSDDPSSYDPSGMTYQPSSDDPSSAGGQQQQQQGQQHQGGQSASPVDRRDARQDAPPPPPQAHYPVPLFQAPPGYPAYGDPNARARIPGYPPDARDHLPPPPGLMAMYPGYPPAIHHAWPPLDMYGRPQPMPPPDYRAGDPRLVRMPGAPVGFAPPGKRDSLGMPGDDSMEKEGKKPQKKTEVACDFCRTRKLKCDGVRPQCGQCSQRDQSCHYQPGPPNRRGPGKKNRMGDSPGGPGPVSPRQRASKSKKGSMETMILDLGDPNRQQPVGMGGQGGMRDMGPPPPPHHPHGVMGVMGPPPGYLPYPAPPPPPGQHQ